MKTLFFLIPSLAPRGAERALVNLCKGLDKSQYRIIVQTLFDVGSLRAELPSEVEYCPGLPRLIRGNVFLLKLFSPSFLYKTIVRRRYDIVVAYLEGTCTRILSGCPYSDTLKVAWHHTCFPTIQDFSYCYRSVHEAKECYTHYDRIVAVSQGVKQSLSQWIDAPSEVIHNFIHSERILRLAAEPLNEITFSVHPLLVTIGALESAKGYDRLLRVHRRLLDNGFEHSLYIIGEGALRGSLEKQRDSLEVTSTVHFMGSQSNPYCYLSQADLFVCSSYREGLSTVVTEALILGKPIVSTDCGGARDLLGDNSEYGLLTPNSEQGLYDGIRMMLSDPSLMAYYSSRSIERSHSFSQTEILMEHKRLFDE